MQIGIGENIKRLRKAKGLTQEQLAELMNVSCAAVSKWESGDTYPDITMIFPLANLFEVSTDELMGYNPARMEEEIKNTIETYIQLGRSGKFREAADYIAAARKKYPNDYKIMREYMWDKIGGRADNRPDVLNRNSDELMRICDCILNGCIDEDIRLDAITMKAKLFHAAGNTPAALGILENFPSWSQSSHQKAEQLFAKDTPEFRYWVRRNLYELADVTANKLIRTIWYDTAVPEYERIGKCEEVGDMLSDLTRRSDETVFIIMEHMAFAELSGKVMFSDAKPGDIIRIREKCLCAAAKLTERAKTDDVLKEALTMAYHCSDPVEWTVNWLKTTEHKRISKLRENPEFMEMLNRNYTVDK